MLLSLIGGLASAVAFLSAASILRRRQIPVKPIARVELGAFNRLVADSVGEPHESLAVLQSQTAKSALIAPALDHARKDANVPPSAAGKAVAWGGALADGLAPAVGVWEQWTTVDQHVFQAFSHLAGEQVDGVADLLRVVDAKGYAVESAGFAHKLLGHVGEWQVQDHLMAAGATVAMPAATNTPGFDLLADGQAMNVKTVGDAATAAHAHFADYPDIPIIVPSDAAHIPPDALHFDPGAGLDAAAIAGHDHLVIVDAALSHAEMAGQTDHALDVVSDPGPHLHFPWFTAALSSAREAQLLIKGHTDLARAAKNVFVDTAAVGGGGAVGAKTGAFIGAAFGPLGAVVGGIAGGVIGALGGRAVANSVKRAPLESAKVGYETALRTYQVKEAELVAEAGIVWNRAHKEEAEALLAKVQRLRAEHEDDLAALGRKVQRAALLDHTAAERLLKASASQVANVCARDRAALRARVSIWIWPWAGLIAPREAQTYVQHRREFRRWKRAARNLLSRWTGSAANTSACFDLVIATPIGNEPAEKHILSTEASRTQAIAVAARKHQALLGGATQCRVEAVASLRERWGQIRNHVDASLAPLLDALRKSSEELRQELRRHGVEA